MDNKNVVLIGMPSSGKSSSGRAISRLLNIEFIDTDILMQKTIGKKPSDIVKENGLDEFLKLQEKTILEITSKNSVISTGGAVIYSENSMLHLKSNGIVFFLDEEFKTIENRVNTTRKLARNDGKSLEDVYAERYPIYKKYSDFVVDCRGKSVEDIAKYIVKMIE